MKTEFKDVAHLYLGCEVVYNGSVWFLCGISHPYKTNDKTIATFSVRPNKGGFRSTIHSQVGFEKCKPILRRLGDMTNEENSEYSKINTPSSMLKYKWIGDYASKTAYLLSKHFDIFGLIDSGQAIDAKTINQ